MKAGYGARRSRVWGGGARWRRHWLVRRRQRPDLLVQPTPLWVGVWWRVCGCGCVFVENCIVDASIFVVKLLRADGGCLGTRSR